MALSKDLPIYKVAYDLLSVATDFVQNMPRSVKTVLGGRLRDLCLEPDQDLPEIHLMAATRSKHPALPAEPGWTLSRMGLTAKPSQRGKWRVGYVGKAHPRRVIIKDTEAEAIAYLNATYAEFHSPGKPDNITQRWLCRRWVA